MRRAMFNFRMLIVQGYSLLYKCSEILIHFNKLKFLITNFFENFFLFVGQLNLINLIRCEYLAKKRRKQCENMAKACRK